MRHTRTIFFALTAVALILAACGGGNDDDSSVAAQPVDQAAGQAADQATDDSDGPTDPNSQPDDGPETATTDLTPGSYAAQLQTIVDQADADIIAAAEQFATVTNAAFDEAEAAVGTDNAQDAFDRSLDLLLEEAIKVVPVVIPIIQRAIDDIEALDTPDQFVDDQARFLDALREQLALQTDLGDAAANGDIERFYALAPRTEDIENAVFEDVSPEFRIPIAAFLDDAG